MIRRVDSRTKGQRLEGILLMFQIFLLAFFGNRTHSNGARARGQQKEEELLDTTSTVRTRSGI